VGDTPKNIDSLYRFMLSEKSGEERLKMGFSMFRFSAKLILSSFKKKDKSYRNLKRRIFFKVYGHYPNFKF